MLWSMTYTYNYDLILFYWIHKPTILLVIFIYKVIDFYSVSVKVSVKY